MNNRLSEISRHQLEEMGEILREKEGVQGQSNTDQNQRTEWDSLKNVPFRGVLLQTDHEVGESECDEEEMNM